MKKDNLQTKASEDDCRATRVVVFTDNEKILMLKCSWTYYLKKMMSCVQVPP